MILLLCMTVGMFGVSCTGDDGAQGPPGEKGEKGDTGEPGADAGDTDTPNYYGFLESWGSDTGEISCDDPILTGMGMFPGPDALKPLVNATTGQPAPEALEVQCGNVLFEAVDVDAMGSPIAAIQGLPSSGDTAAIDGELILVKTETASEGKTVTPVASTEISRAKSVATTKTFSGGILFADMSTTGGNDEVLDRRDLFNDCRIGTPPSDIRGHWRAVKIEDVTTEHDATTRQLIDATAVTTTTTKVCLRLDSTPGVVKCFIEKAVDAPTVDGAEPNDSTSQQIAIYDSTAEEGMELSTVKAGTGIGSVKTLPPDAVANANLAQPFFGTGANNVISDVNVSRLCNLFEEGLE